MRIGLLRAGANAAMTRTLVIQLGRLGDVVQTTPLFSDLAAHGDEVDALILRSAHEPLLGFSAVANIITIPDSLKPLDDAIACGFRQGKIPVEADELLTGLQLPRYDRIVNASHAPLGCWLAGAIPCTNADARSGGIICDRECLYRGPANVYRVAQLQFREQNLFHVVDLLRGAWEAEPKRKRPRLYTNRAADLRFALPQGRKVALNPGASDAGRCWPAENFARLAEALCAAGFTPILVGELSDHELCEQIRSTTRIPISNFAGSTTISEMATLLAGCDLLVSADTGGAHLAAAVGTTVLGLYGATAWFAETAPYGDNHLVLQTPLNTAMSTLSFEAVLAAALHRLNRLSINDLRRELHRQNQSAWETLVQSPSRTGDPLGGLTYRPVHRDSFTPEECFTQSLREAFTTEFLATRISVRRTSDGCATDSLAQTFEHMQSLAALCSEFARTRAASYDVATAAHALIATMERLRAFAAAAKWRRFSPVIYNLDWRLRMLPQRSPEQTLRAHAEAYASAARVWRRAGYHTAQ